MPETARGPEELFAEVISGYGPAMERLARAYEADADTRRDLLQEIHIALWRSLDGFDGRCSLRTWVYRVAHNVATSHVSRQARFRKRIFIALDEIEDHADADEGEHAAGQREDLRRLYSTICQLEPLDRQVMLAYLEGMDAASTAEITGLSARNVATKIHRIKSALSRRFRQGGQE